MSCHLLAQLIETILQPSSTIQCTVYDCSSRSIESSNECVEFFGALSVYSLKGKAAGRPRRKRLGIPLPPSSNCIAVVRQLDGLWPAAADSL
jgi:hypothetical protein